MKLISKAKKKPFQGSQNLRILSGIHSCVLQKDIMDFELEHVDVSMEQTIFKTKTCANLKISQTLKVSLIV